MADRVAILSSEGGRRKRKALVSPATSNVAQDAQIAQQVSGRDFNGTRVSDLLM
jgi:hypothetical protein